MSQKESKKESKSTTAPPAQRKRSPEEADEDEDDFQEDAPKSKFKKQKPLKPKAERKPEKAARKAAKSAVRKDGRSRGRENEYVIAGLSTERRAEIWREVVRKKNVVSRREEKMPMADCWTFGSRKGYSYYSLGHGNSQLKLTQLAVWIQLGVVSNSSCLSFGCKDTLKICSYWCSLQIPEEGAVIAHRCHFKPCFNPAHLYVTDTKTNSRCNGCPAYCEVEGMVIRVCAHAPNWCMRRDPHCPADYVAVRVTPA